MYLMADLGPIPEDTGADIQASRGAEAGGDALAEPVYVSLLLPVSMIPDYGFMGQPNLEWCKMWLAVTKTRVLAIRCCVGSASTRAAPSPCVPTSRRAPASTSCRVRSVLRVR